MIRFNHAFGVILAAVLCCSFFSCDNFSKKPDLKKASLAEVRGNIAEAFGIYTDVLFNATPVCAIPNVNDSKTMTPDEWKKEIEKYLVWLKSNDKRVSEQYQQAYDGVAKLVDKSPTANRLINVKTQKLDSVSFAKEWNSIFFAPAVKINPDQQPVEKECFSSNMSYLRFSSRISYLYTINMFNPYRKHRIEAHLFPENDVTFLLPAGDYYFICKSTVTFESGQIWISPYTISKITIPEESSLITANIVTSVSRN